MYKQKLKHVLSEHHDTASGLKMDGVASISLIQSRHTESELGLRGEAHGLQADLREKKLHNKNCVKELKLVSLVPLSFLVTCFISVCEPLYCTSDLSPLDSQQKHQVELMELANGYDRRIRGE